MLTAVRNQIKIMTLSIKYALMREMLNKVTFLSNVIFMILNNSCMIIQWIIIFGIKDNIGDYTLNKVILLWGFAASSYGISHFFFKNAYNLSDIINTGKLDTILVQPKNVLLSVITTDVSTSAIGDLLYGYIMLIVYGLSLKTFLLFTLFSITGALIITSSAIIMGSFSFWFGKSDVLVETTSSIINTISTYPDGIFKGFVKILLYTIIPVGIVSYIPVNIMDLFNPGLLMCNVLYTIVIIALAFIVFNTGLKRYSSSNLMNART